MKKKVLTQEVVKKLGLDKVEHITADMLDGYTKIGGFAFWACNNLISIEIPNSVTSIEEGAFKDCSGLNSVAIPNSVTSIGYGAFLDCSSSTSVTIGDVEYKSQEVIDGKCNAYKAFNGDMTCRKFQYEEGKTYEMSGKAKLCERGFHACLNIVDVFNYYYGEFGEEIHIHEVELEGVSTERMDDDSKIVGSKITIGKRIV